MEKIFYRVGVQTKEGLWYDKQGKFTGVQYKIYKDPVTDDGTKKSLKGLIAVFKSHNGKNYGVQTECTPGEESERVLQVIYENGKFFNQVTLSKVRERLLLC